MSAPQHVVIVRAGGRLVCVEWKTDADRVVRVPKPPGWRLWWRRLRRSLRLT